MKNIFIILFLLLAQLSSSQRYKGAVDIGFASGAGEVAHNRFELSAINGFQFNDWLYAGVGITAQLWQVYNEVSMPLFINVQTVLNKGVISPLADLRVGYSFDFSSSPIINRIDKEGVYLNPSFGFRWALCKRSAFRFTAGYLFQRGAFNYFNGHSPMLQHYELSLHSLVARLGVEF